MHKYKYSKGFSIVELAMVVTIMALVIAAVGVMSDLRSTAKLRVLFIEMQNYLTAQDSFRKKYHYRPGDHPNPGRYFTDDAAIAGNGNNLWDNATERDVLWLQLSDAQLIPDTLTKRSTPETDLVTIGVNRPASAMENVGWTFIGDVSVEVPTSTGGTTTVRGYNALRFGGADTVANETEELATGMVLVSDHKYIDSKMDAENTPLSGRYIVSWPSSETACVVEGSSGAYSYIEDDDVTMCAGNIVETGQGFIASQTSGSSSSSSSSSSGGTASQCGVSGCLCDSAASSPCDAGATCYSAGDSCPHTCVRPGTDATLGTGDDTTATCAGAGCSDSYGCNPGAWCESGMCTCGGGSCDTSAYTPGGSATPCSSDDDCESGAVCVTSGSAGLYCRIEL